jgi:hypothetical protein
MRGPKFMAEGEIANEADRRVAPSRTIATSSERRDSCAARPASPSGSARPQLSVRGALDEPDHLVVVTVVMSSENKM